MRSVGRSLPSALQPSAAGSGAARLRRPHLCGCRCASAAAPEAGGGCGRSARRRAAPAPCGPPRARAAARSALGARTPPCRRPRWSPPVRAARGLDRLFPVLPATPRALSFCPLIRQAAARSSSPTPARSLYPLLGVPWSPLLRILCHSALPLSLTLSLSLCLSVSSRPFSHPHLVHVEVVYNSIEASVQVIEQGHHLEGERAKGGGAEGPRLSLGGWEKRNQGEDARPSTPAWLPAAPAPAPWLARALAHPRPGSPAWACSLLTGP